MPSAVNRRLALAEFVTRLRQALPDTVLDVRLFGFVNACYALARHRLARAHAPNLSISRLITLRSAERTSLIGRIFRCDFVCL